MKIKSHQLKSALSKELKSTYVISGDELLLALEASDTIRSFAYEKGYQERIVFDVDGKFDWTQIYANVNTLSLFDTKKILELRLVRGKLNDQGSKTLVEVCKILGNNHLLLIVSPKLDRSEQRSLWLKTLTAHGAHIEIARIKGDEVTSWIAQRLKKSNIQKHSLNFYKELLEILSSHKNPIEGHYMERLWCYMFTKNKTLYKSFRDVLTTKLERLRKKE